MKFVALFFGLALAGCASTHAPLATVSAPITGTVNIGSGQAQLVPTVETIVRVCSPPAVFMDDTGPLPKLPDAPLSLDKALSRWLADRAALKSLRADHAALSKWVKTYCQK